MSLAKIPFAIFVAWGFKKCITSPTPPPAREELAKKSSVFDAGWYIQTTPGPATTLQWIVSIIEILTILDYHFVNRSLSLGVYLHLLDGAHASNLRLSTTTTIGGLLICIGTFVRLLTYQTLGSFFRFEASIQKDHKLITSGPYSIVRHPGYTGLILSHSGWLLWHLGEGSWVRESGLWSTPAGKFGVLGFWAYVCLATLYMTLTRMGVEDAALRAKFGKNWDRWAEKVPYSVEPNKDAGKKLFAEDGPPRSAVV